MSAEYLLHLHSFGPTLFKVEHSLARASQVRSHSAYSFSLPEQWLHLLTHSIKKLNIDSRLKEDENMFLPSMIIV